MVPRSVEAVSAILAARSSGTLKTALAVGCGTGEEAATLATTLGLDVTGVDLAAEFCDDAHRHATLLRGDATALEFPDASFDLVYCYHVLEHIPSPVRAVLEMARVLRDDGMCWVGTPNRLRLLGYIGSNATWGQRFRWNLDDWKARARGRFTNELGAHAGFSRGELRELLRRGFHEVESMSRSYYGELYGRHRTAVRLVTDTALGNVLLPSVYFLATAPARGGGRAGASGTVPG
jgi:SAM-dependent methyltransferase